MKLTKSELQKIIKEEIDRVLSEDLAAKDNISEADGEGLAEITEKIRELDKWRVSTWRYVEQVDKRLREAMSLMAVRSDYKPDQT